MSIPPILETHKSFSPAQILRLVVGIGLVGIIGFIYLPYAFFTYSSYAVVSGRIISLTTPIDGVVAKEPPPSGTELHAGDVIATFVNTTVDRSTLSNLQVEKASLDENIKNLKSEKENMLKLQKELEESKDAFIKSRAQQLDFEIKQAQKRHEEILNTVSENSRMLARNKKLFEKKDVSTSTLDSTFFSTERATRSAEQAQLEEHRLLAEKDGLLTKNVFINQDGRSEVTYQDQRIHEIRIRLEEIHSRTGEQEVRLSAINKRIDLETARLSGFESREIRAPSYSVIQKSYVIEGTHVDAKTKVVDIIDCTKVFMDMTIHDGYFQKIKVGERVTIQLRGVSKKLHGTVAHLRGGTLFAEPEKDIAGVAPLRKPYEMQVLIHIDPEDLYNTAADYCHVGHTGEVSFDGMRVVK